MSHNKPTVNERLIQSNQRLVENFGTRILVLETLVGAIIKHFDLKIEEEPKEAIEHDGISHV